EPDAVLGLRHRLDGRAGAGDVDLLVLRRERRRAAVHLCHRLHRHHRCAVPAALLLSRADSGPLPPQEKRLTQRRSLRSMPATSMSTAIRWFGFGFFYFAEVRPPA